MKKCIPFISALCLLVISIVGCSKQGTSNPKPQKTTAQLLIEGGKWVTTGAVLYTNAGDSTVIPSNSNYLGADGAFLLSDVTFKNDSIAHETDFGDFTWSLTGTNPTYLNYKFDNEKIKAKIISLTAKKLVIYLTDTQEDIPYQGTDYTTFKQVLTN